MAGPKRTTVGQIATQIVTDVHGSVGQLPAIAEALGKADRGIRLTAMWALCLVPEFEPQATKPIVKRMSQQAAVEAQFVVDILDDYHGLDLDTEAERDSFGPDAGGDPGPETGDEADSEANDDPGPEANDDDSIDPPQQLHGDASAIVRVVVEEMWKGPRETPSLLQLLDDGPRHVRLTAMWALLLITEHHPTNVGHLAARSEQLDSRESVYLVDLLDHYHDLPSGGATGPDGVIAPPEQRLEENLWGPYITYPNVEDRVIGEQSNTFTPDSSVLQAVSSIDIVGLTRHERVYVGAGTVNDEYQKFNLHTYVPDSRYENKDYQRNFQPAIDGWTEVDDLENVASIHDYGRTPNPWVATSYLPRPLWAVGPLPPKAAIQTVVALCDTVAAMHEAGTAHGGISPWSVGLVQTAAEYVPKLTRVGMAHHLGDERALRIDERFAPPEAFTDEYGSVGRLSDVYGLGVTLYTLLTGETPPYPRDLDGNYVPTDVPQPTTMVQGLPTALDEVMRTATATEKPWRYETVTRLGQELRSILPRNARR